MNTAPVHDWLRSVTFRNATALPMQGCWRNPKMLVTRSKFPMTKSIEEVFNRN